VFDLFCFLEGFGIIKECRFNRCIYRPKFGDFFILFKINEKNPRFFGVWHQIYMLGGFILFEIINKFLRVLKKRGKLIFILGVFFPAFFPNKKHTNPNYKTNKR